MFGIAGRRSAVLVAVVCAGLGAAAVLAVQAGAQGGTPTTPPKPSPNAQPPLRPKAATGKVLPRVIATNAHCGQTITASLTLNGDLSCFSGAGLIVNANNAVLNLNGHTIFGPGTTFTGVELGGKSDTVENGVVTEFSIGVQVLGPTDTVLNVRATFNGDGIDDFGLTTKITNSTASGNSAGGIDSAANGGTYSGDHEVSNSYGVEVFGQNLTVTGNFANGNANYGIYDQGLGTTLTKNAAYFNARDGIYVNEVAGIDGGGNTAKGNDHATGTTPVQCRNVVCS
jgi:hypothetical protein